MPLVCEDFRSGIADGPSRLVDHLVCCANVLRTVSNRAHGGQQGGDVRRGGRTRA